MSAVGRLRQALLGHARRVSDCLSNDISLPSFTSLRKRTQEKETSCTPRRAEKTAHRETAEAVDSHKGKNGEKNGSTDEKASTRPSSCTCVRRVFFVVLRSHRDFFQFVFSLRRMFPAVRLRRGDARGRVVGGGVRTEPFLYEAPMQEAITTSRHAE